MSTRISNLIRYILLFPFFVLPTFVYAQKEFGIEIEQEPYNEVYSLNVYGVKKQVIIALSQRGRPSVDSMFLYEYDLRSRKIKDISYRSGKRNSITTYQHSADGKIWSWRSERLDSKTIWTNKTIYIFGQQPSVFYNLDFNQKGDTVGKAHVKFYYNKDKKLTRRDDFTRDKLNLTKTLSYQGTNMVLGEIKATASGSFTRYKYTYNPEHLPTTKLQFSIRGKEETLMRKIEYYYTHKRLTKMVEKDLMRGEEIITLYGYDNQGQLVSVDIKKGDKYRKITYSYEKNRLIKINAEGNTYDFNRELLLYSNEINSSFIYERVFGYDDKGNMLSDKEFYNDKLWKHYEYRLTYY